MLHTRSQLFLLFFLILFQAKSQNVVPNPSFESVWVTPCDYITIIADFSTTMKEWKLPNQGTSDMFSNLAPTQCYANCSFSTQAYSPGSQAPRTGNNMCGFTTYGGPNYREYLQVKLSSPLITGQKYYAEIFVSAGERMQLRSNNIGMYFSNGRITASHAGPLPVIPQIKTDTIIMDTINWVKISGTFIATSSFEYLTIGNFNDDLNTLANRINNSHSAYAYYFIDDVLVKSICNPHDSSAAICKGSSITLDLNDRHITGWSLASSPDIRLSNTNTLTVSPEVTTRYVVHYDCNETSIFEVVVNALPAFTFGKDTNICQGEVIFFDAASQHSTYLWQDGSTQSTYTARTTGQYAVTIKNGCGSFYHTVFVQVDKPASFGFGTDTTICLGETRIFDATTNGASYLWQDGSTNPIYTAQDSGYYSVTIKNTCGTYDQHIVLNRCCIGARIPNLITPNGDDLNDNFHIDCFGNGDYELVIYNRWGAVVYQNLAYLNNWKGTNISDGIYYYVIKYKNQSINNGWVQILRKN
jgi:gliding motility-associated-like protein